jgi:hypothetical protein
MSLLRKLSVKVTKAGNKRISRMSLKLNEDDGNTNAFDNTNVFDNTKQFDNTSQLSTTSDEKNVISSLHKFYNNNHNSMYTNHTTTEHFEEGLSLNPSLECKMCLEKTGRCDNYIVLSCNHVFHVSCLAESQFMDVYKYHIIDSEYFGSRQCLVCSNKIQTEEMMFLHSKFLSGTKGRIESHDSQINNLEGQMKQIKEELRVCYEYKHKLEHEREKSKQIVATLMTMI